MSTPSSLPLEPQGPYAPGSLDARLARWIRPSWVVVAAATFVLSGFARSSAQDTNPTGTAAQETPVPQLQPFTGTMGTADSNSRMIAVAGVDITGSSVLYVIDTIDPHLAIYSASSGSGRSQGVELIGARKIALDLRLDGYNDQSKESYKALESKFIENGLPLPK